MSGIKSSPLFLLSGCASAFMLGAYCVMYSSEYSHALSPATMPDFDIDRYDEPWYNILLTKGLPWNDESFTCSQDEIRKLSNGNYWYYSRWYELDSSYMGEMDVNIICMRNEPGKCAVEFGWQGYSLGA